MLKHRELGICNNTNKVGHKDPSVCADTQTDGTTSITSTAYTGGNEQTYQSMVIWLRIMNRQVAHIQTMTVTEVGKLLPRTAKGSVNEFL